jgi:hypothetical protein
VWLVRVRCKEEEKSVKERLAKRRREGRGVAELVKKEDRKGKKRKRDFYRAV